MHEISIANNIIEILEDYSQSIKNKKMKAVYLKIGEMSNVLVESLLFGFKSLVHNTKFERIELIIENIPLGIICRNCKEPAEISEMSFDCKFCGNSEIEIISGRELEISKIEFED